MSRGSSQGPPSNERVKGVMRTGPLWGLPGGKSLVIRIVPVSVPVQASHFISPMSIAQHCQVALYHVARFESKTPPNQLAAMSESSRARSRTPPGTPRTPVRTLISVLGVQVVELKAEVASQKRTIDYGGYPLDATLA